MAFNREKVEKQAKDNGYSQSSANSQKMIDGKGNSVVFSETNKSVKINGSHYNSDSDTKKSKSW